MNTTINQQLINTAQYPNGRFGITRSKKANLDLLADKVIDAQYIVDQNQQATSALTQKLVKFEGYFATADANRTISLNNLNTLKSVIQNSWELRQISSSSLLEMTKAKTNIQTLAIDVRSIVEKLIFTVETINNLNNLIVRKKALNPLISDELMTILGTTGTDANNAVALMLVAMKSVFSAQASCVESDAAAALEFSQSIVLQEILTGSNYDGTVSPNYAQSLEALIENAYENSKLDYLKYQSAVEITKKQLNEAQVSLSMSQTNLASFQASLAAANAAALAS